LQEPVYEGKHEPFANLKDLQNVITDTWHDVDIKQPESERKKSVEKKQNRCERTVAQSKSNR